MLLQVLEKSCWFIKVIIHAVNLYQHSSSDAPALE